MRVHQLPQHREVPITPSTSGHSRTSQQNNDMTTHKEQSTTTTTTTTAQQCSMRHTTHTSQFWIETHDTSQFWIETHDTSQVRKHDQVMIMSFFQSFLCRKGTYLCWRQHDATSVCSAPTTTKTRRRRSEIRKWWLQKRLFLRHSPREH